MTTKNIVNNSSNQKDEFINNIRNLLNANMQAQIGIPKYEGMKIKLYSVIDIAKTIYRNLANVLPEINSHIAAGKLISVMYLKFHELMCESKTAHIKDYLVKEKEILKIRKIALKVERKCRKCLFVIYDLIQSTKVLIIPNYEKIVTLQTQLENMYNLRPRTVIYYGEEDGNFEDPKDDDYNPSDDEDDEEFDFDEDDNNDEFIFDDNVSEYDEEDDNDSEYTPSEADEDEEEFDFDEKDDNDSDYNPDDDVDDEDDEEFDFDEEDDDDEENHEDNEDGDEENDKQFISDYLNDPDYNPDEDEDEEDEYEYDFSYLNKTVDDNENIVLKAGIAYDNDEEDEEQENDEEDDKNMLNICKRRFENGKVLYRWVKMTKEEAEKKYDEDYVLEEN